FSDISGPGASTHRGQVYAIESPFTAELHYPPEGRCWAAEKRRMKEWLEGWNAKYVEKDLNDGCVPALVLSTSKSAAEKAANKRLANGHWPDLVFGEDGQGVPSIKKHLKKVRQGVIPMTFWADEEYDTPFELGSVSWAHDRSG